MEREYFFDVGFFISRVRAVFCLFYWGCFSRLLLSFLVFLFPPPVFLCFSGVFLRRVGVPPSLLFFSAVE